MHVFYLHQYFSSRQGTTGTRSYEFSEYLVAKGHHVTMITSGVGNKEYPVSQHREDDQGETDSGEEYVQGQAEGIRVVAINAGYNDPMIGTGLSGQQRMLKFYEFARRAGKVGRTLAKPDVVFATHTPLPIGLAGISISRHFGVPFVFEVRDLWPEGLVDLGVLRNPLAIWWLKRLAKKIYRHADHIVALAPGMKEGILQYGVAPERVTVIPNASDLDLFRPDLDDGGWREKLGLGERFAAIYFGAMGKANNLGYVIEAARILHERGKDEIVVVLLGDGGQRAELEETARHHGLENVVFHDPVPKAELAHVIAGCQACITILRPSKHNAWSPNKMFDSLAAGKPVLINVPGWLGETIEGNGCGLCLDPHRPETLADALEQLSSDGERCKQMGVNARALAEREFDRAKLAARLEKVLVDVTGG